MQVKKTQMILYKINKGIHLKQLHNIRSTINRPAIQPIKPKQYHHFTYNRRQQIKNDDKLMINKILEIAKADHLPKFQQHRYRPIKRNSMRKWEINQDNYRRFNRITSMKPAIGSISQWNRQYQSKSLLNKTKRYNQLNKSLSPSKFAKRLSKNLITKTVPDELQILNPSQKIQLKQIKWLQKQENKSFTEIFL